MNLALAFCSLRPSQYSEDVRDTRESEYLISLKQLKRVLPESFDLLINASQSLKENFKCEVLDEDRNLLTKQMIEHMRQQVLEYRRQFLASTG